MVSWALASSGVGKVGAGSWGAVELGAGELGVRELGDCGSVSGEPGSWRLGGLGSWKAWSGEAASCALRVGELEIGELGGWGLGSWGAGELAAGELAAGELVLWGLESTGRWRPGERRASTIAHDPNGGAHDRARSRRRRRRSRTIHTMRNDKKGFHV